MDFIKSAETERRKDRIHLAGHSSATREAQYVTTEDQGPGHHAVRQSDLGVIIDSNSHTADVVRSCFYQLRQLRSIRRSLTTDARRTLATAFVANRVDYCNAVLYGTSTVVTRRLQMVLNAAARMLVGMGQYEHITPSLPITITYIVEKLN